MKKSARTAILVCLAGMQAFSQTDSTGAPAAAPAQEPAAVVLQEKIDMVKGKINGIEEDYLATKATVEKLAKIKISGYVQAQYRAAVDFKDATDSTGKYRFSVGDAAGGKFNDGVGGQFEEKRGRLKVTYDNGIEQAAMQIDATPSSIGLKEAWAGFKEPFLKTFGIRAGVMDRPIGFEPCYSSGTRETPEESRVIQTMLPSDYDLGAMLEILPSEKLPEVLSRFNIRTGLFTGNAISAETDNKLDWIGRLGFSFPFTDINLAIDGGIGGYVGTVTNTDTTTGTPFSFKIDSSKTTNVTTRLYTLDSTTGVKTWRKDSTSTKKAYDTTFIRTAGRGFSHTFNGDSLKFIKSSAGQYLKTFKRQYFSADLQMYYDLPVIGGTSLRGELLTGVQPGNKGDNKVYAPVDASGKPTRVTANQVYMRNFMGYYAQLVQNVNPLNSQILLKYDVYDPNTDVAGADISKAHGLSIGEIKYTTIGGGVSYYWGENVKLTAYYDRVYNEFVNADLNAGGADYTQNLKDDVFTFRVQYKF